MAAKRQKCRRKAIESDVRAGSHFTLNVGGPEVTPVTEMSP